MQLVTMRCLRACTYPLHFVEWETRAALSVIRERVDRERWSDIEQCEPILRAASFFALLQCALQRKTLLRNSTMQGPRLLVPKTCYPWKWHWLDVATRAPGPYPRGHLKQVRQSSR